MPDLPAPFAIPTTLGGPVGPRYVVPRPHTLDEWWNDLRLRSLRLTSLRRIGKSTQLRVLESHPAEGWIAVYVQVQQARSLEDLINLTLDQITKHASHGLQFKRGLRKFSSKIPVKSAKALGIEFSLDADLAKNSAKALENALKNVAEQLLKNNLMMVIILDEFTDALRNIRDNVSMNEATHLLSVMRSIREGVCRERIRWFLAGSVGFHHVLRSMPESGRSLMDDVGETRLGGLDQATASWFAHCLLLEEHILDPAATAPLLAEVANGIPFILDLMVRQLHQEGGIPLANTDDARSLLQRAAANLDIGTSWTPMLAKVQKDYYGEETECAESILDALATKPLIVAEVEKTARKALPNITRSRVVELLNLLKGDDYLIYDPDTKVYAWQYTALRDIWRTSRGN